MVEQVGTARIPAALLQELANRADIGYIVSYRGKSTAGTCMGVTANLKGLGRFGDACVERMNAAQHSADIGKFLQLRDLVGCLDRLRCDSTKTETVYYWPNITVY